MIKIFKLLFLIISFSSFSQNGKKAISGQILDEETKEPIPFASIYIENKTIGTTSNEEGFFIFHYPINDSLKKIIISSIGYETIEKNIGSFISDEKIFISSKITHLNEVVITATKKKKLSAKQIVKKAYKKIKDNYPTEPYILEGFVRDLQNENNKPVEYLECAAKLYNLPHYIEREPDIEIVEIRSNYITKKNPWNKNRDRKNSLMDLIEDDFIRFDYGPIKAKRGWKYQIEDILLYNNKYVYKITAIDKPFQKATLFIDTESFAFIKMELTRNSHKGKSWKRRLSNGAQQMYYNVIFEYQEYNNKMYLKYQKEEDTWEVYDIENPKKLLFTKKPKKELFINKIIAEDVENYPFIKNMNINNSLENQAKEYNSKFWSQYNAPKQTKAMSKIELYLKEVVK